MEKYKIIIADDHPIIHIDVDMVLKKSGIFYELESIYNGHDLIELLNKNTYDLLLLDINMSGSQSIEDTENIIRKNPKTKVVIYSQLPEKLYVMHYLKIGAYGYIDKTIDDGKFLEIILTILNGKKYFSQTAKELILNSSDISARSSNKNINPFLQLSIRELEVARCLKMGYDYKQIADKLQISTSTISTYKSRIFEKLNIKTLSDFFDLVHQYTI